MNTIRSLRRPLAVACAFVLALTSAAPVSAAQFLFADQAPGTARYPPWTGAKGCTAEEQKVILEAASLAQFNAAKVAARMKAERAKVEGDFVTYFGAGNLIRYDQVRANFEKTAEMISAASTDPLYIYCNLKDAKGEPCSSGIRAARMVDYAETEGEPEKVVFCEPFFKFSRGLDHTQWGSLLHEGAHIAFQAVDRVYDGYEVRMLAATSPFSAIINAENYRQFAEKVIEHGQTAR